MAPAVYTEKNTSALYVNQLCDKGARWECSTAVRQAEVTGATERRGRKLHSAVDVNSPEVWRIYKMTSNPEFIMQYSEKMWRVRAAESC